MALLICQVQSVYLDFLRQFDAKVSMDPTGRRKFVGVLFDMNGHAYFAPMSSPKPKHATISDNAPDIFKIDRGLLGVINLNNMIPVPMEAIIHINISKEQDPRYQKLLREQASFIRKHADSIQKKAKKLHRIITDGHGPTLIKRCHNYSSLEQACLQFSYLEPITMEQIAPTEDKQ